MKGPYNDLDIFRRHPDTGIFDGEADSTLKLHNRNRNHTALRRELDRVVQDAMNGGPQFGSIAIDFRPCADVFGDTKLQTAFLDQRPQ